MHGDGVMVMVKYSSPYPNRRSDERQSSRLGYAHRLKLSFGDDTIILMKSVNQAVNQFICWKTTECTGATDRNTLLVYRKVHMQEMMMLLILTIF